MICCGWEILIAVEMTRSAIMFHSFLDLFFSLTGGILYHSSPFGFTLDTVELLISVTSPKLELETSFEINSACDEW